MEKIKSISEAYSQQPVTLTVLSEKYAQKCHDKPDACKEIKIETIVIGNSSVGDVFMAYVGYNFKGEKIFQYKCDSMNVHYGGPL